MLSAGFALRYIAPVVAVLTVVGIIYGKGRLDAKHAAETELLRSNIVTLQKNALKERVARKLDAEAAEKAAARISGLTQRIEEVTSYVEKLEDANRVCFSARDTDELRKLWKD